MNLSRFRILGHFWALLCGMLTAGASPISFTLSNPGFEAATGSDPSYFGADGKLLVGHYTQPVGAPFNFNAYSVADPVPAWTLSNLAGTAANNGSLPPTEGSQMAYLEPLGTLSQHLFQTLDAGVLYRVEADVAGSAGVANQLVTIGLVSNGSVVTSLSASPAPGAFSHLVHSFVLPSGSPWVGMPVDVAIGNQSGVLGRVYVDQVRVTAETEPAMAVLSSDSLGWWRGGSARNEVDGTTGTFRDTGAVGPGFVGSGLVFTGGASALSLPDSFALTSRQFSVEGWIRRASTALAGSDFEAGQFFGGSTGGFTFGLTHVGRLYVSHVGVVSFYSTTALVDTAWHHVAVSRTAESLLFYLDGSLTDVVPCTVNFNLPGPYAIGGLGTPYVGVSYGFRGAIDEFGVYNRALSSAEVANIYRASVLGKSPSGGRLGAAQAPAVITANSAELFQSGVTNTGSFTLSNLILTSRFSSGVQVASATATLGEVSSSAGTVSVAVPNLPPGQSVVLDVRVLTSELGPSLITNSVSASFVENGSRLVAMVGERTSRAIGPPLRVPSGIVAWWSAENNAFDPINSVNGALSGHASYVPGFVGNAFVFDGADSSIQLGAATPLRLQDLTIEGWIKRASAQLPSQTQPGSAAILGGGINNYAFALLPDGRMTFSQVVTSRIDSTGAVTDTQWHHVAITRGGNTVRFFIDGVDAGSGTYSTSLSFDSPFSIGSLSQVVLGTGVEPFWGLIDELSVYNRALDPGEIASIYRAFSNGKTSGSIDWSANVLTSLPIQLGQTVDYRFSIQNSASSSSSGLVLEQSIPAGWTVVSLTADRGAASVTASGIHWEPGALAPASSATLTVSVQPSGSGNQTLVATLTGVPGGATTRNVLVGVTQQPVVETSPQLSVSVPSSARIPATGTNLVAFNLSLDRAPKTAVAIDFMAVPIYSAGVHSIEPILGTTVIPAGSLAAAIPVPLVAGTTADLSSFLLYVVDVRGAQSTAVSFFLPVQSPFFLDLALVSDTVSADIPPGGNVTGRLRVENRGMGAALKVRVTNSVPAEWTIPGVVLTQGTAQVVGSAIVWEVGSLDPGASSELVWTSRPSAEGVGTLLATVGTTSSERVFTNNALESTYSIRFLPRLDAGADLSILAPQTGVLTVPLELTLSRAAGVPVEVTVAAVDGSARSGIDYRLTTGSVTIPAGQSHAVVPVEILSGNLSSRSLEFQIQVTAASGAVLGRSVVRATIGHILIADLAVSGSASAPVIAPSTPAHLRFVVENAGPASATGVAGVMPIPVGWTVTGAFASQGGVQSSAEGLRWTAGGLVSGAQATLEFDALTTGIGSGTFALSVTNPEPDPASANNFASVDLRAEAPPSVDAPADLVVPVPLLNSTSVPITVRLSAPTFQPVSVDYVLVADTALSGRDFVPASGTLLFQPGVTEQTLLVTLPGNPSASGDSKLSVRLSHPVGASLGRDGVVITLRGEPATVALAKDSSGQFVLRVHMIAGRNYELQRSTAPLGQDWTYVGDAHVSSGEGDTEFTDPLSETEPVLFYRLVITSR